MVANEVLGKCLLLKFLMCAFVINIVLELHVKWLAKKNKCKYQIKGKHMYSQIITRQTDSKVKKEKKKNFEE